MHKPSSPHIATTTGLAALQRAEMDRGQATPIGGKLSTGTRLSSHRRGYEEFFLKKPRTPWGFAVSQVQYFGKETERRVPGRLENAGSPHELAHQITIAPNTYGHFFPRTKKTTDLKNHNWQSLPNKVCIHTNRQRFGEKQLHFKDSILKFVAGAELNPPPK